MPVARVLGGSFTSKEFDMDTETASLYFDDLVEQAISSDDFAFVGTLHVLREAAERERADPARVGILCRAAEYVSEARIGQEQPRAAPGARVRLRSKARFVA